MDKLSIAGTRLEHFHICAFFNSRDEEYDVLCPYFKEGIEQGEKNLHFVDPAFAEEHRTRLHAAGIDAHECEACGQLAIVRWAEVYLDDNGRFDKDAMLAKVDEVTGNVRDSGKSRIRIMGNMDWAFNGTQGAEKLIEYEAEVNEVLARNRQPAVCVYDMAKLSGSMMMDLLRTHPLVLIGGLIQENPFYTPAAEMLQEIRGKAAAHA